MIILLFPLFTSTLFAQKPPETRRYAIEVAGVRVGTMTASRRAQANEQTLYTLISDVKVNFLLYKLTVYYKVDNLFQGKKLLLSTVDARTNRGNFASRTEWTGNRYDIVADQYKHKLRASEPNPINYTVTDLFFSEPTGYDRAFAEYFGDYFALSRTPKGTYRARRDGREDEYVYDKGKLVKIIKKNPLKNFIIRLEE
ncbi:MAG: hypothetical protein H7Z72_06745 [Bacteroidetes bacterium]|nr:hypothetical protein [Fibrella sp.]